MAQLPPKIPSNIITNCNNNISLAHHHNHHRPPPCNYWADDFLDFSSNRRGAHRRSASDSLAFLDDNDEYDVDGQLLLVSMFSDEDTSASAGVGAPPPPPDFSRPVNPSSPSDQNSNSNVVVTKVEPGGEAESNNEYGDDEDDGGDPHAPPMPAGEYDYPINDPKRVKRILANRQSAQRSRVRKLHYISELERSVTALQTEVSVLSPRVAYLDHHRLILNVDNSALKQRIAALAQDKIFKDAHQDALKKEIERLRQLVYQQQNRNNKNSNSTNNNGNHHQNAEPRLSSIPNDDIAMGCTDDDEKIPNSFIQLCTL